LRKNFRNKGARDEGGNKNNEDASNQNTNIGLNNNQNAKNRQAYHKTIKNENKPKHDEELEVMTQFKKMMQWLISLEEEQTTKADNKKEIPQF
jgi:hypothetical protein